MPPIKISKATIRTVFSDSYKKGRSICKSRWIFVYNIKNNQSEAAFGTCFSFIIFTTRKKGAIIILKKIEYF